ncbi:MAG: thymidine phosphorylase [Gemmatimonadales bacterium]
MVVPRLIERKRDGAALGGDEWRALISHYAAGGVPDYQMAALCMAVVFRGLEPAELVALTDAMRDSGASLPRGTGTLPRIDKHSTGGVGDTTSLILAPLLAACGVAVPMMSGRGLGHTGGTLDKLESIPGFRTALTLEEAARQLDAIGVVMLGQTEEIAPADRRLYALRDVTGTVESIPLIAASIMSKKLAESLDGLVLDVKVGSGAFLPGIDRARQLARTMVALGARAGCPTVAVLTAMDRPLAAAAGNALEVREAIAALRGERDDALMSVTLALGVEMLRLAGIATDDAAARARLRAAIASGAALERFAEMVRWQGGDPAVIDQPDRLPTAPVVLPVPAGRAGVLPPLPPRALGAVVTLLGGGRRLHTDTIDPAVGLVTCAPSGARVEAADPVFLVHARDAADAEAAVAALGEVLQAVWEDGGTLLPLILDRITTADLPSTGALT